MNYCKSQMCGVMVFLLLFVQALFAQGADLHSSGEKFQAKNLAGPRVGITYVVAGTEFATRLKNNEMSTVISQFGWHFEWAVSPEKSGPSFITELVPLVGGIEYGKPIPSISLVVGVRLPQGFEFGLGPNVTFALGKDAEASTSLVAAIGQSLNFNDVNIPLNIAVGLSPKGTRMSFLFGYAIRRN